MEKTLYDLDKLEHILEKTQGNLSELEKAAYYAAANVLAKNLLTRWNDLRLSSIAVIEGDMKDFVWHLNTVLGYMPPVISLAEHHAKARTNLENTRRNIQERKVVNFMYAGQSSR